MVLPASVDLVELRYEGGKSEPGDDVSRVTLSKVHKAAQLVLSEDRLTVTGECIAHRPVSHYDRLSHWQEGRDTCRLGVL